jgi:hypothetical protein
MQNSRGARLDESSNVGAPMGGNSMNAAQVQALVRSVIVLNGLPFAVLSVVGSPVGWKVVVRAGTGGIVRFTVAGERPDAMRWTIGRMLRAEL